MIRVGLTSLLLLLSAAAGRAGADPPMTIDLLDTLTAAERADVLAGTNRLDLTAKIGSLVARAPSGAVVDASSLRGTVTLTADPFAAVRYAPVTLRTGPVTFAKDFNKGAIKLPSGLRWSMARTRFVPTAPITYIAGSAQAPGKGMIESQIYTGVASGASGALTVTVDDASNLRRDTVMAFLGVQEDPHVRYRLEERITADQTEFDLPAGTEHTIKGYPYVKVGQEIMRVLLNTPDAPGHVTSALRGQNGTSARAHRVGDPVIWIPAMIRTVKAVSGNTVTLTSPLPASFDGARWWAGTVDTAMSGDFSIDGRWSRTGSPVDVWACVGVTLAQRFTIAGRGSLSGCLHGGVIDVASRNSNIALGKIAATGYPAASRGASLWVIGNAFGGRYRVDRMEDGYLGVAIDNKSFGVSNLHTDQPVEQAVIEVGAMTGHRVPWSIAAGRGNVIRIGRSDASGAGQMEDSASQLVTPIKPVGNSVEVGGLSPGLH